MKIGISSWACAWAVGVPGYPQPQHPIGVMELLDRAIGVTAEVLQIADNIPLHTLPVSLLRELAAKAAENAIPLEIGTRGLDHANLVRYLEIAAILGARLVRTLPHEGNDRPDLSEALRRIDAVKHDFEMSGVMLAIENHDDYPSLWLRQLIEAVSSPAVGVCLDAVNNFGQGESFAEVIGNLGQYTVNFHCKDYRITRKSTTLGFDIVGCPAGEGMLDLRLAYKLLRDDISWIIESWVPWQEDLESTIHMEKDWLTYGISNLKAISTRTGQYR